MIQSELASEASAPAALCSKDLLGIPSTETKSGFNAHDKTEGKEEWLTPPEIIKALEQTRCDGDEVPWPFDLDPCAPTPETRPWETAKAHYCIHDNGLVKPWAGRVWCNPPYGGETGKWMARCAAHGNVTALIFARTETQQFFESIWPKATAVCFIKGRLSFYHVSGKKGGTAGAPSMLVTWDDDNANALWDAVQHGRIKGAFVDLRAGKTAGMSNDELSDGPSKTK